MGKEGESVSSSLPEELIREIEAIREAALIDFSKATDQKTLEQSRVVHLGMKGAVSQLFERIPRLQKELRRAFGQQANAVRAQLDGALAKARENIDRLALEKELSGERLDVTAPGRRIHLGRRHPVSQTLEAIVNIFARLGFDVATGPEIETDFFNFEALNLPLDHPARDMQDTFYVDEKSLGKEFASGTVLLRTQTSPVQIHTMLESEPPIRIIAPGKVYRRDSDITHTPMFHQVEGLLVDKKVSFAELKGTLQAFIQGFFGSETKARFRPSYFPFTEPSAEVDISCVLCSGSGCRVCKMTGWLEVLGAGMVHPNVFRAVKYDPDQISGYAFGIGVERLAMLRFGIDDLRTMFENDARFLEQF